MKIRKFIKDYKCNIILLISNIVFAFLTLYFMREANSIAEKDNNQEMFIAKESGILDKGEIDIRFGTFKLPKDNHKIKVVYGSKRNAINSFHMSRLPFIVSNSGDKTVSDLLIGFIYHSKNQLALSDSLDRFETSLSNFATRHARLKDDLAYDQVYIQIPKINPKFNFSFDESITLQPTVARIFTADADSNLTLNTEMFFEHRIDIYTSATDLKTTDYPVFILKLEVNSLEELIERYIELYLKNEPKDELKNIIAILSFNEQDSLITDGVKFLNDNINPDKFYYLYYSSKRNKFIVLNPDFKVHKVY